MPPAVFRRLSEPETPCSRDLRPDTLVRVAIWTKAEGPGMAELAIISETGMFHSLCRCTWGVGMGAEVKWYGFAPIAKSSPHGPGAVHTEARPHLINHIITFDVDDFMLRQAIAIVVAKYANATYTVTVKDCVSFTADVAREIGLRVPLVNMTPWGLIQILRLYNSYTSYR
jgi:hypothetical protein